MNKDKKEGPAAESIGKAALPAETKEGIRCWISGSLRMAADRCNQQYNKIINSLQLAEQFRKEQIDVLKNGTHFGQSQ